MKYAAESFNQDFGYKVKFSFRGLAPIDAASRMIQDGGSARVADIAEIEHDLLGRLVVAGGAMENLVSADRIQSTFLPNATAAAKYAGASYGFPVSYATLALFYNKDLLPTAPKALKRSSILVKGLITPKRTNTRCCGIFRTTMNHVCS